MADVRLARIKTILAAAVDLNAEERPAYLDAVCGSDLELRREVEAKLVHADADLTFLRSHGMAQVMPEVLLTLGGDLPAPADAVGRTISHYRLDEFLGAGAVGEVYRATDTALGLQAAIKLLRPDVGESVRQRLVQEARTSARLSHPAIAQYYDSGEFDGIDFMAMEYVPGETLRSRVAKGPLPPSDALAIATALLEALAHAHGAGYLHRDIKPENIVVMPAGTPKLLDFGIAKRLDLDEVEAVAEDAATVQVERQDLAAMTALGVLLGTPGYMSPEQLRGDSLSERTDVFALGAVLYEMLSGEAAFPGHSWFERATSTLSRDLPPVHRDGMPLDIDVVLRRALARDPDERYHSAAAFLSDLRRVTTGQAVAFLPRTLAVMDLENLRGEADDDWIGSGTAERLGVDLRRAEGLDLVSRDRLVKARTRLKQDDRAGDPVAVGLAVGSRWVLAGSFQRLGPQLRLTVRLVEVSTGNDLWTEVLDGRIDDLFAMQDRLAELTARSLSTLLPRRADPDPSPALDVFEHYARARDLFYSWEIGALDQAREHLDKALALDPEYAPALAMMAGFHAPGRWMGTGDPKLLEVALDYATRAIAADPDYGEGYTFRAYALWRMGEIESAIACFERATAVDPTDYLPWYLLGCCRTEQGDTEAALAAQREALAREGRSPFVICNIATALAELGDLEGAIWTAQKGVEVEGDPESVGWAGTGIYLGEMLRRAGRLEEARDEAMSSLDRAESRDDFTRRLFRPLALVVIGRIHLELGDVDAARVAFNQAAGLVRSRESNVSGGHTLVQALSGLTRCGEGSESHELARRIFERRDEYDFSWGGLNSDRYSLFELARAAEHLGRDDEAADLLRRARELGAGEGWIRTA